MSAFLAPKTTGDFSLYFHHRYGLLCNVVAKGNKKVPGKSKYLIFIFCKPCYHVLSSCSFLLRPVCLSFFQQPDAGACLGKEGHHIFGSSTVVAPCLRRLHLHLWCVKAMLFRTDGMKPVATTFKIKAGFIAVQYRLFKQRSFQVFNKGL